MAYSEPTVELLVLDYIKRNHFIGSQKAFHRECSSLPSPFTAFYLPVKLETIVDKYRLERRKENAEIVHLSQESTDMSLEKLWECFDKIVTKIRNYETVRKPPQMKRMGPDSLSNVKSKPRPRFNFSTAITPTLQANPITYHSAWNTVRSRNIFDSISVTNAACSTVSSSSSMTVATTCDTNLSASFSGIDTNLPDVNRRKRTFCRKPKRLSDAERKIKENAAVLPPASLFNIANDSSKKSLAKVGIKIINSMKHCADAELKTTPSSSAQLQNIEHSDLLGELLDANSIMDHQENIISKTIDSLFESNDTEYDLYELELLLNDNSNLSNMGITKVDTEPQTTITTSFVDTTKPNNLTNEATVFPVTHLYASTSKDSRNNSSNSCTITNDNVSSSLYSNDPQPISSDTILSQPSLQDTNVCSDLESVIDRKFEVSVLNGEKIEDSLKVLTTIKEVKKQRRKSSLKSTQKKSSSNMLGILKTDPKMKHSTISDTSNNLKKSQPAMSSILPSNPRTYHKRKAHVHFIEEDTHMTSPIKTKLKNDTNSIKTPMAFVKKSSSQNHVLPPPERNSPLVSVKKGSKKDPSDKSDSQTNSKTYDAAKSTSKLIISTGVTIYKDESSVICKNQDIIVDNNIAIDAAVVSESADNEICPSESSRAGNLSLSNSKKLAEKAHEAFNSHNTKKSNAKRCLIKPCDADGLKENLNSDVAENVKVTDTLEVCSKKHSTVSGKVHKKRKRKSKSFFDMPIDDINRLLWKIHKSPK